jgi:uncharacterized membrane protein
MIAGMQRSTLDRFVLERRLDEAAVAVALDVSGARPGAAAWRAFLIRVLDGAGIAALGAGAIFFVAANWQDYGVLGRFALLQVALLAATGLALWRPPPAALGQAAVTLAVLFAGALLALFGQTYQTGADVYELFFIWAALAFPFALASASAPVWATWWVVLNVGMALYCGLQDATLARLAWSGRLGIERPLLLFLACLLNLGGAILFDHLGRARWLVRTLATLGFLFGTAACFVALFGGSGSRGDMSGQDGLVVLLFAATCGGIAYESLRRRRDVFPMALVFGAWIAISTAFLVKQMQFKDFGNVLVLAAWLIATSGAAGFVLMKWVREWRAT